MSDPPHDFSPRVSVVLLTYNVAAYIAAAIAGVLDQTFRDFELIIVDDASTDETFTIAADFQQPGRRL